MRCARSTLSLKNVFTRRAEREKRRKRKDRELAAKTQTVIVMRCVMNPTDGST